MVANTIEIPREVHRHRKMYLQSVNRATDCCGTVFCNWKVRFKVLALRPDILNTLINRGFPQPFQENAKIS